MQPANAPLGGGEIWNPAHDGERHVEGLRLDAILSPLRDEILQAPRVHLLQIQGPDEGIELFQLQRYCQTLHVPMIASGSPTAERSPYGWTPISVCDLVAARKIFASQS